MELNPLKPRSTPGGHTNPAEHSRAVTQSVPFLPGMTASLEPKTPIPTNPTQNGFSEKPERDKGRERHEWFLANFVKPLQDNFRRDLTEGQVEFWLREVTMAGMTRAEIIRAVEFIKRDCQFFPTLFDFHRLRPAKREPYVPPEKPVGGYADQIAQQPLKAGSWEQFVRDATVDGLEGGGMVGAYDKIIAEGEKRGIPELDNMPYPGATDPKTGKPTTCFQNVGLGGFRQARVAVLKIREEKQRPREMETVSGKPLSRKSKAYIQHMKDIGKFQRFRPEGVSQAMNYDAIKRHLGRVE